MISILQEFLFVVFTPIIATASVIASMGAGVTTNMMSEKWQQMKNMMQQSTYLERSCWCQRRVRKTWAKRK